ncbi:MAG TPA: TGS domain-containing protein [Thermoanaerobaculales bacterium]|nr:TGS domain-containing protein [Thermoanaerobaculales bacterium]
MPTNVTAQYRTAEAAFRAAKTIEERRSALEAMLATVPKHKGTEKLQADIKRRLARLRQEAERHPGHKGHSVHVEPEGAAQVVLLGAPNAGKSSLLAALTHATPNIADYPFATTKPQPGMMRFEDVQIQLVDLPPITAEHMDPWLPNVVQTADAAVLLADPSSRDSLAGIEVIRERMAAVHIPLVGALPEDAEARELPLPTLLVLSKADLADAGDLEILEELYAGVFPIVRFSATKHIGHQQFRIELWRLLQLIRVYTKPPGKRAERSDPFVLHSGSTVHDLADRIHADLSERLAYARVWGGKIDGQRVAREFELRDRDVVELAT